MLAHRDCSYGTLSELELEGYCDFGFPIGHLVARQADLRATNTQLDEVIRAFARVFDGRDIVTARLLAACRAHLALMHSAGAALRLVARDLEGNLRKVEGRVRTSPEACRTLTSLLELERQSEAHDGNVLADASAAMGLLWIRRSLAFQSHLYDAFVPAGALHPKEAALEAYTEHLSPYHGWMLRKIFGTLFSGMPGRDACMAVFGGVTVHELDRDKEHTIAEKVRALTGTLKPLLEALKDSFEKLNLEDTRRI